LVNLEAAAMALARRQAAFVALEFILRKRRLVMVNAGFRFAKAQARLTATRR
jgi:hypothetical protein